MSNLAEDTLADMLERLEAAKAAAEARAAQAIAAMDASVREVQALREKVKEQLEAARGTPIAGSEAYGGRLVALSGVRD